MNFIGVRRVAFASVVAACLFAAACDHAKPITQDELVRRSQGMMDAVPAGDQTLWKQYFADDVIYFDEKGRAMDKAALIADLTPMPKGYGGTIEIENPKSVITPAYAVVSFDENETETIFGQELQAKYHETDTWVPRNGDWQIVAGQVLRYYEDPLAGTPDKARYPQLIGTYELTPGTQLTVTAEGDKLYRQRGTSPKVELITESGDVFFRKGVEGRLVFHRDAAGKVDAIYDRRNNEDVIWEKVK
jgi:hypothetical protein